MAGHLSWIKVYFSTLSFLLLITSAPIVATQLPININGITYMMPVNTPPLSNSDVFFVNEIADVCDSRIVDTTSTRCIYILDVLANDLDPDNDPITILSVAPASYGSISIVNNKLRYVPGTLFFEHGSEIVTYQASDPSGGQTTGTAAITLNRAPLVNYDGFSIPIINSGDNLGYECNANSVDTSQCAFAVSPLANDPVDSDGDAIVGIITYRSSLADGYTDIYMPLPANGSDNVSTDGMQVIYQPSDRCFYGTQEAGGCDFNILGRGDSAYRVIDERGAISKLAFISYSPDNTPPSAINDGEYQINMDTSILMDVLANDSDEDGHTISLSRVTVTPQSGSAVLENNQIRYTPNTGYIGSDVFTYEIVDSLGAVGLAQVSVKIVIPNTPPLAVADNYSLIANNSGQYDVLINDSDADGHTFSLTGIALPPTSGIAVIELNKISYTPNTGFVGNDQLTYQITDELGAASVATVTFSVTNSAPNAVADSASVLQNSANNLLNVLLNDSDADSHELTIQAITTAPLHGAATVINNQIQYTPNSGFVGSDSLIYQISDEIGATASATLSITVDIDNAIPIANSDAAEVNVGDSVTIDVSQNDTDGDNDALTINAITVEPNHGTAQIVTNKVVYTPTLSVGGTDSFTYSVSDGKGGFDTATVTITIKTLPTVTLVSSGTNAFQAGASVTIEASAFDAEDSIVAVRFRIQSQSVWTEYTNPPYIHDLGSLTAGSVVVEMQAEDSSGARSAIVSETLTIAPAISINASWQNSPVKVGTAATLTWSASNATQCFSAEIPSLNTLTGETTITKYSVGIHEVSITCQHVEYGFEQSVSIPLTTEKLSAPQGLGHQN